MYLHCPDVADPLSEFCGVKLLKRFPLSKIISCQKKSNLLHRYLYCTCIINKTYPQSKQLTLPFSSPYKFINSTNAGYCSFFFIFNRFNAYKLAFFSKVNCFFFKFLILSFVFVKLIISKLNEDKQHIRTQFTNQFQLILLS